MVQNYTLLVTVDLFGDEGNVSIENPADYNLDGVLPELYLTDVRDEVVQRILNYAQHYEPHQGS